MIKNSTQEFLLQELFQQEADLVVNSVTLLPSLLVVAWCKMWALQHALVTIPLCSFWFIQFRHFGPDPLITGSKRNPFSSFYTIPLPVLPALNTKRALAYPFLFLLFLIFLKQLKSKILYNIQIYII